MYNITQDQSQRLFHALDNLHSACEYWENQEDPVLKEAKDLLDEIRAQQPTIKKPKYSKGDRVIILEPPDYENEMPWPTYECVVEAIDVYPRAPGVYYRLSIIGIDNYTCTVPESELYPIKIEEKK